MIIKPVASKAQLKDFLNVPFVHNRADPNWVPPLYFERKDALSPQAPFFEHARWQAWVAYDEGKPIARISAQIDDLYAERHNEQVGYFGMFECPDALEVAAALFAQAEAWLREQGATRAVGPFNLGINQELGLLVDGFDTPPYFMMPHNPRRYEALVTGCGYMGVQDLLAYVVDPKFKTPPVMAGLLKRQAGQVRLRKVDKKNIDRELETIRDIFNDAWSENWGFVPFTEKEFRTIGREMLMIIPDEFIYIAEVDGSPDAFIVLLANVNEAIADLNGRLLPFGWAKLLWRLKVRYPQTGRVPLMGVRRQHHHTRLGPGLAFAVIDRARDAALRVGMHEVELSWILDDNMGMRNIIESISGRINKRYRMYSKDLDA